MTPTIEESSNPSPDPYLDTEAIQEEEEEDRVHFLEKALEPEIHKPPER